MPGMMQVYYPRNRPPSASGAPPSGPPAVLPRTPHARKDAAMAWDFSTEPEFQEKLDWIQQLL